MFNNNSGAWKLALSVLFFPMFFQDAFISFAWGAHDSFWIAVAKRVFILLPVAAFLVGCWVSGISILTLIVRHKRVEFATSLLMTWWDLGKAVLAFWSGILKFSMFLVTSVFSFGRLMVLGTLLFFADICLYPFQLIKKVGQNAFGAGIPWIAVTLTLGWTLLEATIFTFVTSPLVVDTLSNMIGQQLSEKFIRAPLFLFMFFIVLGSYSVLLTLTDSFRTKNVPSIIKIGVVELVAMFVEVVFLYREFVDALVPWFAQHSAGFELGVTGTLAIAGVTWLGIRSLSWFLFASHGTPVIMAVIQGRGYQGGFEKGRVTPIKEQAPFKLRSLEQMKKEFDWIQDRGDAIAGSLLLPPLQILAASINFVVLLMTAQHLFDIPLNDLRTVSNFKPKLKDVHDGLKRSA